MQGLLAVQTVTTPTNFAGKDKVGAIGVAFERVDRSTRCFIQALFSERTHGFTFFINLLNNAVIQPYTLPHPSQEVKGDTAVISVTKGYAELSQLLDLSYDTTHMYALVFRALGLLTIEKQGKQMTINIPLHAYRPPAGLGEILRELQLRYRDRRPKICRLINNIIGRIASLIPIEQEAGEQPYQNELLKRVQRGLSAQGVADPDGHIALSILTEIAPLIATRAETPTAQVEQGITDFLPRFYRKSHKATPSGRQEATQRENQDQEISGTLNLPGGLSRNEKGRRTPARATTATRTTIAATAQGRFNPKNLPCNQQVGGEAREDVVTSGRFVKENLPANQQTREPLQNIPACVDANLPVSVDSGKISPFTNGIGIGKNYTRKLTNYISVPDPVLQATTPPVEKRIPDVSLPIAHPTIRHQALALATLIEGNEKNVGAFVKLLRKYDLQAIRAGVIATLRRKYFPEGRKALSAPGGYFTRQVQRYQDALPEQMVEVLETYAQASYEEIEAALEKQAQAQAVHRQPGVFGPSRTTSRSRQGLPMDEGMATKLAERIAGEDPDVQVKGICKLQDGTYAVKVYIDPVEHGFCSIEEWETYHAQMQALEQGVSR